MTKGSEQLRRMRGAGADHVSLVLVLNMRCSCKFPLSSVSHQVIPCFQVWGLTRAAVHSQHREEKFTGANFRHLM